MKTELSPDIILFKILPRLPAKSVGRFMCVSRQWHSFLTTPVFTKMRLQYATNDDHQNHQKLLLLSTTIPYKFRNIDCETPKDGLTASSPLPFEVFEVGSCIYMSIVASLHGLVCIQIQRRLFNDAEVTDLILWNPLTSDYKMLSKPRSHKQYCNISCSGRFGLYYTSSDDDYKLLCVTHRLVEVYIYSLKSDSWRNVESTKSTSKSYFLKPSVLLKEKLYFLKQKQIGGKEPSCLIDRFDTKTEKLDEIAIPLFKQQRTDVWGRERTECKDFVVLKGSIHFCAAFTDSNSEYHKIELWKMNGDRDGDWTKLVTYSPIKSIFGYEKPLHIMRNGDWLIHREGHVYQRDMKKHTCETMCRFQTESMEIDQRWKYMETLVSPNQYMIITPPSALST